MTIDQERAALVAAAEDRLGDVLRVARNDGITFGQALAVVMRVWLDGWELIDAVKPTQFADSRLAEGGVVRLRVRRQGRAQ